LISYFEIEKSLFEIEKSLFEIEKSFRDFLGQTKSFSLIKKIFLPKYPPPSG